MGESGAYDLNIAQIGPTFEHDKFDHYQTPACSMPVPIVQLFEAHEENASASASSAFARTMSLVSHFSCPHFHRLAKMVAPLERLSKVCCPPIRAYTLYLPATINRL